MRVDELINRYIVELVRATLIISDISFRCQSKSYSIIECCEAWACIRGVIM